MNLRLNNSSVPKTYLTSIVFLFSISIITISLCVPIIANENNPVNNITINVQPNQITKPYLRNLFGDKQLIISIRNNGHEDLILGSEGGVEIYYVNQQNKEELLHERNKIIHFQ